MLVFNEYAKYYDALYQDKDYLREVTYIENLISDFAPETKNILELGCGTGRHASYLAKKYKIKAIDFSESMLEEAYKLKSENLDFSLADVRTFSCAKKFDTVISLFHIASYQNSNDDFQAYLQTAHKHLKKSGIFIFDFWYGPAVLHTLPEKRLKSIKYQDLVIQRKAEPTIFYNENRVNVHYDIEITKNSEKYYINEDHSMRYFFLPEITYFLKQNGFELIFSEESFSQKSVSEKTWSVTCAGRKL